MWCGPCECSNTRARYAAAARADEKFAALMTLVGDVKAQTTLVANLLANSRLDKCPRLFLLVRWTARVVVCLLAAGA